MLPENQQNISSHSSTSPQGFGAKDLPARPRRPVRCNKEVIHGYSPHVATELGLEASSLLFIFHLWMKNPNAGYHHEGRKWIWNGYLEWQLQMPWFSVYKIGEIIRELEDKGILISANFHNNPYDRRKWYTIDYRRLYELTGWNPLNLRFSENPTIEIEDSHDASKVRATNTNNNHQNKDPQTTTAPDVALENRQEEESNPAPDLSGLPDEQILSQESAPQTPVEAPQAPKPTTLEPTPPKQKQPSQQPNLPAVQKSNPDAGKIRGLLERAGMPSHKLYTLALGYGLAEIEKALGLLKSQTTEVKNPTGWLTKCLRGKWWKSAERQKKTQSQPWAEEFETWYAWAIDEGIVQDVERRYLPTDYRGEPQVRFNIPDHFTGAPYTLEHWRAAAERFPMPESLGRGDLETGGRSQSARFVSKEPLGLGEGETGGRGETSPFVSGEMEDSMSQERSNPINCASENPISKESSHHPVPTHDVGGCNRGGSQPSPGRGGTSFPVSGEVKDSISEASSITVPPPMPEETVNRTSENAIPSESPPPPVSESPPLPVQKNPVPKYPDYTTFPWTPKNGWQPGANRERLRQQKAEWCRKRLLKVSSDADLERLMEKLGDTGPDCIVWVDTHLLLPQEVARRHMRIEAERYCQQPSIFDPQPGLTLGFDPL